ncbi:MAG TPA: Gfo/Idh/MocA family oxidoreductase [Candidatus Omnitrophota bacterium]|nr:Gfo/Idh/MocA family oxidoreductase [Candidatus Omnitrophota bacterium]
MKVLFFGLGSIGQRHATLIKKNFDYELYAFRSGQGPKNGLGLKELHRWDEVERIRPDVAFITNPTALHIKTAIQCAKRRMHLFIEKPIDAATKDLNRLKQIVKKNKLSTYVAYCLRFHPVILELKKILAGTPIYHMRIQATSFLYRWRKGSDPKKSYSARAKMGGGVILDLSHELDYIEFILGEIQSMKGDFDRRSDVTVDSEDYADFLIQTKKAPVNLHLNFMSQLNQRIIQVDCKKYSFVADIRKSTLSEYRDGKLARKKVFKDSIKECYVKQLNYFFAHLGKPHMMNDLEEAGGLFEKICAFKNKGNYRG